MSHAQPFATWETFNSDNSVVVVDVGHTTRKRFPEFP